MVYIIGVDHLIQYDNTIVPEHLYHQFTDLIKSVVNKNSISLIAEEFSVEAITSVYHAERGILQETAADLGVFHRYCDPEENDRIKIGIPYYAEIRDQVKKKYKILQEFILDDSLRATVKRETMELSKQYWSRREEFWLQCIIDYTDMNVLFVCGHDHVDRFRTLIIKKGIQSSIIDPFWKGDIFNNEIYPHL